jgi:hypothetical protein
MPISKTGKAKIQVPLQSRSAPSTLRGGAKAASKVNPEKKSAALPRTSTAATRGGREYSIYKGTVNGKVFHLVGTCHQLPAPVVNDIMNRIRPIIQRSSVVYTELIIPASVSGSRTFLDGQIAGQGRAFGKRTLGAESKDLQLKSCNVDLRIESKWERLNSGIINSRKAASLRNFIARNFTGNTGNKELQEVINDYSYGNRIQDYKELAQKQINNGRKLLTFCQQQGVEKGIVDLLKELLKDFQINMDIDVLRERQQLNVIISHLRGGGGGVFAYGVGHLVGPGRLIQVLRQKHGVQFTKV